MKVITVLALLALAHPAPAGARPTLALQATGGRAPGAGEASSASPGAEPDQVEGGDVADAAHDVDLGREQAWIDQAQAALERADYHEARAQAAQAVSSLLARPGNERGASWLQALDQAANAAWRARDAGVSKDAWEVMIALLSRTRPEDHPELQRARLNLASSLNALGDLHRSRELLERVLEVRSRTLPEDDMSLQVVRQNLAATIARLGQLREARALFERVLEVYSRTLPEDHLELQKARGNLATTAKRLGDLQAARALEERALEALGRTLPREHPDFQMMLGNLAVTLALLGDRQGARALGERVLEIRTRTLPDEHPEVQRARLNLASTPAGLGDRQGARKLEELVLDVLLRTLPEEHADVQRARVNLGATMLALGDAHSARALLERAVEHLPRIYPPEQLEVQIARLNLASALRYLGDWQGARALYESALAIFERTLPAEHPYHQSARLNLAILIADQVAQRPGAEAGEVPTSQERGRYVELLGTLSRTQALAARAAIFAGSRREAEERCARLADSLEVVICSAASSPAFGPMPELVPDAFAFSESTRGAAIAWAELARRAAGSPRHRELLAAWRTQSERLAALARQGATAATFDAAIRARDEAEREIVALGRESTDGERFSLELDAPTLSAALEAGQAAVAFRRFTRAQVTVPRATAEEQAPDAQYSSIDGLCAFVLRPASGAGEGELRLVDLGPLDPIEAAATAWRAALGGGVGRGIGPGAAGDTSALEEHGERLRALIFDPLLAALDGAREIVLVLDDLLHLVPFDALPAGGTADAARALLGELYRFELRATLTELVLPPSAGPEGGLLALGGATFDHEPLGPAAEEVRLAASHPPPDGRRPVLLRGGAWERGFAPLASTDLEARELAELYARAFGRDDALVLSGRRASRTSLEELAPRSRWLHVATHGWYAPESIRSWEDARPVDVLSGLVARPTGVETVRGMSPMLLCGLALAGANLPEDAVGRAPGLVTAEELATLDLSGCELAVLSACDTNVGHRRAGQGVASLQRALQIAGARSVITSLWKVPDEATKELMLDFYRRLWVERKPKHQALWEAKLRLRDARDERGEPRYTLRDWGAWVLSGEPD